MFNMFPFLYNNGGNRGNNNRITTGTRNNNFTYDIFSYLLSDDFINNMTNELLNNESIINIAEEMIGDDPYEIEFRDNGDFYKIRGYLPGLTAKDIKIDFEKNKAILTIKRKQVYTNNNNFVAMFKCSEDVVKNFYIEEIDVTKLRASFDNNVLIIEIPKVRNINSIDKNEIIDVDNLVEVEGYKEE